MKVGKDKLKELAKEISILLESYDCHTDTAIYYSNQRLSYDGSWKLEEGFKGSSFTQYANDSTITMTFEGNFYEVMNYGLFPKLYDKFSKLLEKYGFYFELGNAWNLALYEI